MKLRELLLFNPYFEKKRLLAKTEFLSAEELQVLQKGSTFERFLSVRKMRNYAKKIGIARYTIDDSGFVLEMIERIM